MSEYDETIFETTEEPESRTKTDTRDALQKASAFFHKPTEGDEPDWQALLLNAQNVTEKFKIRAARQAYQEEKQFQHFQQQQELQQAHIAEVLRSPRRNKVFYDNLKVNDPKVYWSVECQRQMKSDKLTMGLGFHLKGK